MAVLSATGRQGGLQPDDFHELFRSLGLEEEGCLCRVDQISVETAEQTVQSGLNL